MISEQAVCFRIIVLKGKYVCSFPHASLLLTTWKNTFYTIIIFCHFLPLFDRNSLRETANVGERGDDIQQRATGWTRTRAAAVRTYTWYTQSIS